MFWNKKKAKNMVVWRDRTGKIACQGDNCPQGCDKSCPIWLNTLALKMLQIGECDGAIKTLKEALAIAPDFVDAQNNLGTAYGMNNQHAEAHDAFSKALIMRPKYPKAMSGLIVAEKNMGEYDEALRHCDEYEQWGFDASDLRAGIREAMGEPRVETLSYIQVATELLEKGRGAGYIQSREFTHIPEIVVQAEEVSRKIIVEIFNYLEAAPGDILEPVSVVLAWSAFAGMGAVYHWHTDWNALSRTGIFETLTAERGLSEMDEYVMDVIGIGFGSEEEQELTGFIRTLAGHCYVRIAENGNGQSAEDLLSCAKAMYLFGMTFEMNRLGML